MLESVAKNYGNEVTISNIQKHTGVVDSKIYTEFIYDTGSKIILKLITKLVQIVENDESVTTKEVASLLAKLAMNEYVSNKEIIDAS